MTSEGMSLQLRPVVDDPETRGFFEAAREHRLAVQRCQRCGHLQQPPRPRCRACREKELGWLDIPGQGSVHSWIVVERQIHPAFPVPYTVLLVDVEPRPGDAPVRFVGHIDGRPEMSVGDRVRVVFLDLGDGVILPNWAPLERGEADHAGE